MQIQNIPCTTYELNWYGVVCIFSLLASIFESHVGRDVFVEHVTKYELEFSTDGWSWTKYRENGSTKVRRRTKNINITLGLSVRLSIHVSMYLANYQFMSVFTHTHAHARTHASTRTRTQTRTQKHNHSFRVSPTPE